MLKKFTPEGRFECGLDKIVAGKVWCFAPIATTEAVDTVAAFSLGIAVANEPGYYPVPREWCHGDNFNEMADHAETLNRDEGIPINAMYRIIASTMRRGAA